jgi:hypothetical protein
VVLVEGDEEVVTLLVFVVLAVLLVLVVGVSVRTVVTGALVAAVISVEVSPDPSAELAAVVDCVRLQAGRNNIIARSETSVSDADLRMRTSVEIRRIVSANDSTPS